MADNVRISNMPDSGSPERVAYDLWQALNYNFSDLANPRETVRMRLALYSQCLNAVTQAPVDVEKIK